MKFFLFLLSALTFSFPVLAKERTTDTYKRFECSREDPACEELATSPKAQTSSEKLNFERVIDGDTLVASGRKIRIWGIDAPEKNTPAYMASSWLLQSLVSGGDLTCKFIDLDKYKREVMHCLIDGLDIGAMMVKVGMAKDYKKYSGGYYQQEQSQAKAAKRGIWKLHSGVSE